MSFSNFLTKEKTYHLGWLTDLIGLVFALLEKGSIPDVPDSKLLFIFA